MKHKVTDINNFFQNISVIEWKNLEPLYLCTYGSCHKIQNERRVFLLSIRPFIRCQQCISCSTSSPPPVTSDARPLINARLWHSVCFCSRPSSRLSPSISPLFFTNLRRTPVETGNFRMNRDRQYSSSVQICFSVLTNDFV